MGFIPIFQTDVVFESWGGVPRPIPQVRDKVGRISLPVCVKGNATKKTGNLNGITFEDRGGIEQRTTLYDIIGCNYPIMETLIIVLAVFAALVILGSSLLNKRNNDDQKPDE